MAWYKHEHGTDDAFIGYRGKIGSAAANGVKQRLRPAGKPEWYEHPEEFEPTMNGGITKPIPRLTNKRACDYMSRNVQGQVDAWWSHDDIKPLPHPPMHMPPGEGMENASKARSISEDWFIIDPSKNLPLPKPLPKTTSKIAQQMIQRSHGQMEKVFQEEENRTLEVVLPTPRVTKHGKLYADRSNGRNVQQIFKDEADMLSGESTKAPQCETSHKKIFQDRNKDNLKECFQGFPDAPPEKITNGRGARGDGAKIQQKNTESVSVSHLWNDFNKATPQYLSLNGKKIKKTPAKITKNKSQIGDIILQYGQLSFTPTTFGKAKPRYKHGTGSISKVFNHDK